ncbi:CRISPR system precrRNA processing endoribonuclease RAMP protein Cas6 [Thauera aromatica]|uniref:CRISPR system precrRNA processing endoribonuclease RAMP protein Cas6 n=1 Tax=Thauera aromatica TaxID=59405 RepID=UPI001FFCD995|nr:CRISPR system precrRNA processing endoribonuclease RAMP protein Cas6 [Thauera aromatica]MCK2088267.1 CRISPR system precrRNA processing endoribonuclease RAMP protein Cas6 [Thauera aromatica]
MPALPLARYRFTFRMAEALRLPDYAGSLLRGQFGAALRRTSCMTRATTCDGCPLRTTCPYPAIFEAPAPAAHALQNFSHIPNPYVIEPPPLGTRAIAAGESLQFGLVLFGRALEHLPLISFALQRAAEGGLGRERAHGTLESLDVQDGNGTTFTCIWQAGDSAIDAHDTQVRLDPAPSSTPPARLDLHLHTPLRLQHQGQPVRPHALTPRKLIADLLRRITLLAEFHADRPGLLADAPALVRHADTLGHHPQLRWHDWSRYSSRQQREMTLGGALGTWTLEGELTPLLPWLRLGEWLHVGKNATLGMGRYVLSS